MHDKFGEDLDDRQDQDWEGGAFDQTSVSQKSVHRTGNRRGEEYPWDITGQKIDNERHIGTDHLPLDPYGENSPDDRDEDKWS